MSIEKFSDSCFWIRDLKNSKILYSIQENEILIGNGKGVIPFSQVDYVGFEAESLNVATMVVRTKENSRWNERQRKNHPILWKLGLIAKSTSKEISLGLVEMDECYNQLKSFIAERGVSVN
ncbi:hypothetical protein [Microbulbifer agarilyticus]